MSATLTTGGGGPGPEHTPEPAAAGGAARAAAPQHDLPVLEAYRGVAALLVVLAHVGYMSGTGVIGPWAGWLARTDFGVAMFFLLSGFLLFRPYVQAAYGRRPMVETRSYLRRRFVRIYPAYLVLLVGVFLLSERARDGSESVWLQTIFLVQNYGTSFTSQLEGLVQIWSLVVEVSFYVALPLLAPIVLGRGTWLARRTGATPAEPQRPADPAQPAQPQSRRAAREAAERRGRQVSQQSPVAVPGRFSPAPAWEPWRPLVVLGVITVFSLVWRYWYATVNGGLNNQNIWLPGYLDWFAAGMALAWLRERPQPLPQWLRQLAQSPGVCFCLALAGYWLLTQKGIAGPYDLSAPTTVQMMIKHIAYEIVAILVMIPAVFGSPTAGWRRHALHPVMSWLGRISFGVFLWHPILLETVRRVLGLKTFEGGFWITLVLTVALSVAVGTLSWRYVEEPLQRRFRNGLRQGVGKQASPAGGPATGGPKVKVRWSGTARPRPAVPAAAAVPQLPEAPAAGTGDPDAPDGRSAG